MLTIASKIFIDALIAIIAAFTAALLVGDQVATSIENLTLMALAYAAVLMSVQVPVRLYRHSWRYVSPPDLLRIVQVALAATLVLALFDFLFRRDASAGAEYYAFAWILLTGGMAFIRSAARASREQRLAELLLPLPAKALHAGKPRMILIGTAFDVDNALREIIDRPDFGYEPVGLVLDDDAMKGQGVRGLRVLGSTKVLESVVDAQSDGHSEKLTLVFASAPASLGGIDQAALARLRRQQYRILRLPKKIELAEGDLGQLRLRRIRLEELLSRPPVQLPVEPLKAGFRNRRVMVTGAGGTIGGELSRQAAALGCSELILLDLAETPLFDIDMEIGQQYGSVKRQALLRDVRDKQAISQAIEDTRPDVIFHAAALKHVGLMEHNAKQALETNVMGTMNVAHAAREHGVEQMVLISTDKAVDPVNVMGATKRIAEAAIHSLAEEGEGKTRFGVVRFGNVLGSNGSVVPIFRRQIEAGGPVRVTHPEMERYFMIVPEAVQLVLHATLKAAENGSEPAVYVLDMGEPVKIVDMARRLIDLCAPEGHQQDIQLVFSGIRPGEKLKEALVDTSEETIYVSEGLQKVRPGVKARFANTELQDFLKQAQNQTESQITAGIYSVIRRLRE